MVVSQAGCDALGHAAPGEVLKFAVHGTHVPEELQTGVVPPQFAELRHCTQTSRLPFVSQKGVSPEHWASEVHWTQLPAPLQIGVPPPHCALLVQLVVHTLATQFGPFGDPAQSAFTLHWTHVFEEPQTGFEAGHANVSVALHW